MKFSFRSINKKVNFFLENSLKIKSSKLRSYIIVVLYLAAVIGLFGVLPFILGIYLFLLIADSVNNKPAEITISAIIILLTLVIGIPWAMATYGDYSSNTNNKVLGDQASSSQTTTKTPEDKKSEEPTKTSEPTIAPKTSTPKPSTPEPFTPNPSTAEPKTPEPSTPEPKVEPQCDPNYSGTCVPIASDVDCAGGSGNGPAYVHGPVTVIGRDIYGLDRDGDGIGCEN
jgi:hypothetical protein